MKLSHYQLNQSIDFEKCGHCEWIIESQEAFSKYVGELYRQWCGAEGNFNLSISNKIISLDKKIEIIFNPLGIDINEKRILNKLYAQLNEIAYGENFYGQTMETLNILSKYIFDLEQESRHILSIDENIDPVALFKAVGVKHEAFENNFQESLSRYIKILGDALEIKLVVFINLRSYLSEEEIKDLIRDVSYEEVRLLLIESHDMGCIQELKRYIIDKDLCEI